MAIGQTKAKSSIASTADNAPSPLGKGKGFLNEVIVELKKTTWPTPREAWRLTVVVMGVIIAIAVYMGVIDMALSWATKKFNIIK